MGDRELATSYLQRVEGDINDLRQELADAVAKAEMAEIRMAAAEARTAELEANEDSMEEQCAAAKIEAASERARAVALAESLKSERAAREEADKRCTAMMAEMKRPQVPALLQQDTKRPIGVRGTIRRDSADNMVGFDLVFKEP